jgi:probable phosphoglycerate mutase
MRLLFIRHGQTPSNVRGLLDSRIPGADLSALGRRQAAAIPAALDARPITSITVTNMVRTAQTAAPLAAARGLVPVVDEDLREIEAGDLEMASGAEALARYVDVAWAWAGGNLTPRMAGAQDGAEFFERFDRGVERARTQGGSHPVIVSHAACIRVWVARRCRNVPPTFASDVQLHNTGSAEVEHDDQGWQLREWNELPLGGDALHAASGPENPDPTGTLTAGDTSRRES